jgi:pSer/pThr/pTyr-binding forkhead associated (FHA) protein
MPRLDFYANFKPFVKVKLAEHDILIGRGLDCDIQLADEMVSRHHARIEAKDGGHLLHNLSPNGTRVNHAMVTEPQLLKPGDRIYIEGSVVIYQPDDAPSAHIEQRNTVLKQPALRPPQK